MSIGQAAGQSGGADWSKMLAPRANGSVLIFAISLFTRFLMNRPVPLLIGIFLFVITAFSGIAGVGLLLPILETVQSSNSAPSGLTEIYSQFIRAIGLEVSLEVLLVMFAVFGVLEAVLRASYSSYLVQLGEEFRFELRSWVLSKTTQAEWSIVSQGHSADTINAIVTESSYAAKGYVFIIRLIGALVVITGYFALALFVSLPLALGIFVSISVSFLIARPFLRKSRQVATSNVENNAAVVEALNEHFATLRFLRAMALDAFAQVAINQRFLRSADYFKKLLTYPIRLRLAFDAVVIVSICVLVFVAVRVLDLGIGEAAVLIGAFLRIIPHTADVQQSFQFLSVAQPSWRAVEGLVRDGGRKSFAQAGVVAADLQRGYAFENVSVQNDSGPVFEGLSFSISAGEAVLITGPSGSGKSTIVDLLVGLRSAYAGQVLIGGLPIETIDMDDYRKQIALVPQEPLLTHDSIEANVRISKPNATSDEVWHALEAAGAADFVRARAGGLASPVGDLGSTMSGGQRQRIALARALLRRPQLLILDEPTSALDASSERVIFETIQRLRGQLTMLIINHRPESINFADKTIDLALFASAPEPSILSE